VIESDNVNRQATVAASINLDVVKLSGYRGGRFQLMRRMG
jgi:hypothetical protein